MPSTEDRTIRCIHCRQQVTSSIRGPVGAQGETTCVMAPRQTSYAGTHTVPDDVCGFDTDGDGNCGMALCKACRPETRPAPVEVDPAWLLTEHYNTERHLMPQTRTKLMADRIPDPVTVQDVINVLRTHEADTGTRFVALPVQALNAIRLHWEADGDEEFRREATRLVRDLFDGQDGHLLSIDRVLGPR